MPLSPKLSDAEAVQVAAYREMSAARKLEIAAGLRQFAWDLKTEGLRRLHPDLDESALQAQVRDFFRSADS